MNSDDSEPDISRVLDDVAALRDSSDDLLSVPEPMRTLVSERLERYCHEVETAPRTSRIDRRAFIDNYGTSFWRVIARPLKMRRVRRALNAFNAFR